MFVRRLDFHASWGMLLAFDLVEGDEPPAPVGPRSPTAPGPEAGPAITRVDLHERNLSGLSMPGFHLANCRVDATPFHDSDLSGCALVSCQFDGCVFLRADLSRVTTVDTDFIDCSFEGADLSGADLRGASFAGACTVRGASFAGARLLRSQVGDLDLDAAQTAAIQWVEG